MTIALVTIAAKLGKLLPLLSSDKAGEVVATAAAITRMLKAAGADWHDLTKALTRAEPESLEPMCWRDIPPSERLTWLAEMRASRLLSPWERDFVTSILAQLRYRPWSRLSAKQVAVLDRVIGKIVEARR